MSANDAADGRPIPDDFRPLSMRELSKLPELRIDGRGPSYPTLVRWMRSGRLKCWKVGGRLVSTRQAVAEFIGGPHQPGHARVTTTTTTTASSANPTRRALDAAARLALRGVR